MNPTHARRLHLLRLSLLALLWLIASVGPALAHTRSMSFSRWTFDDTGAHVRLRISLLELTRFPAGAMDDQYFARTLQLIGPDGPLAPSPISRLSVAPEGWAIFQWHIPAEPGQARAIRSVIFNEIISSHSHFARIVPAASAGGDSAALERILTVGEPEWDLNAAPDAAHAHPAGSGIGSYFILGLEHILTGWDHLAFVAVLLLLATNLRELLLIITGFTVAHSLTLALAVLGVLRPHSTAVEIHIAFSIALVAIENLWLLSNKDRAISGAFIGLMLVAGAAAWLIGGALGPVVWLGLGVYVWGHFGLLRDARRPMLFRAFITFLFGLVHGMGFAGILMELHLPAQRVLHALLGFNIGVEAGQVAAVLLLWPLLALLRRSSLRGYHGLAMTGSAAMLALGVFWAVTRTWG